MVQIGKELGCEPDVKEAIRKRVDGRTRIVVEEFKDRRMLLTKSVKLRESDSEALEECVYYPRPNFQTETTK